MAKNTTEHNDLGQGLEPRPRTQLSDKTHASLGLFGNSPPPSGLDDGVKGQELPLRWHVESVAEVIFWIPARLWVLTRLMSSCCYSYCCCSSYGPSVRVLRSAFTSAFRSAITLLSHLSIFLMTSQLVCTRSVSPSASFSFSSNSCANSSFWFC